MSILGVGLLGGSIGLAVKSVANNCYIAGYGHRRATLEAAESIGAIDQGYDELAEAVRDSDLVILCTPVGLFQSLLSQLAPHLKPGALVTDVGSTKRSIVRAAEQILPPHARFVGSHPMAGSEKRGVEFARTDLFQRALCITTPTPATDRQALEQVESFWKGLGMRVTRLAPEEHDRMLAEVSHLPHALAAALVHLPGDAALGLAGKGFLDATRIAGGDGALWRDIFLDNRDHLRAALQNTQKQIEHLMELLQTEQGEALRQWLDQAAGRREALLRQKLGDMNPD
jgi:prephenate dehydrogenase